MSKVTGKPTNSVPVPRKSSSGPSSGSTQGAAQPASPRQPATAVPGAQLPSTAQRSPLVQGSPSEQAPAGTTGPGTQAPARQTSPEVQGSPSSQAPVSMMFEQTPRAQLSAVQGLASPHSSRQLAEQQSPSRLFPSSHSSPGSGEPFPQMPSVIKAESNAVAPRAPGVAEAITTPWASSSAELFMSSNVASVVAPWLMVTVDGESGSTSAERIENSSQATSCRAPVTVTPSRAKVSWATICALLRSKTTLPDAVLKVAEKPSTPTSSPGQIDPAPQPANSPRPVPFPPVALPTSSVRPSPSCPEVLVNKFRGTFAMTMSKRANAGPLTLANSTDRPALERSLASPR